MNEALFCSIEEMEMQLFACSLSMVTIVQCLGRWEERNSGQGQFANPYLYLPLPTTKFDCKFDLFKCASPT